jgi:hypothetical protein
MWHKKTIPAGENCLVAVSFDTEKRRIISLVPDKRKNTIAIHRALKELETDIRDEMKKEVCS